jgi:hypothetical protein
MKKPIVIVALLLLALVLVLPGDAIARLGSPSSDASSSSGALTGQGNGVVLTGGSYNLVLQPATADSDVDQTSANAMTGGNYQLINSPQAITNGCCCKASLPCQLKH